MITFVEGRPGSGKSNYLVAQMRIEVAKGRKVITNIPLKKAGWDRISPRYWDQIVEIPESMAGAEEHPCQNWDWLEEQANWKGLVTCDDGPPVEVGPAFFLDEIHFIYPSGVLRRIQKACDFWTKHRHYGVDAWFATQQAKQTRLQILRLADEHVLLARNAITGIGTGFRKYRYDSFGGALLDRKLLCKWDVKAFSLYHSQKGRSPAPGAKGKPIYLRWQFLLLAGLGVWALWKLPDQMAAWSKLSGGSSVAPRPGVGAPPEPVKAAEAKPVEKAPTVPGLDKPAAASLGETAARIAAEGLAGGASSVKGAPGPVGGPGEWEPSVFSSYPCSVRWKKNELRVSSAMLRSQGWRIEFGRSSSGGCTVIAENKARTVAYAEEW